MLIVLIIFLKAYAVDTIFYIYAAVQNVSDNSVDSILQDNVSKCIFVFNE